MKGEGKRSGTLNDFFIFAMPRWTEVELRVYWYEKKMEFYIQITFYIIPDINSYLEKYLILVMFCLSTRTYLRDIIPCLIPKKVLLFLSPF